jgi:hypothetical protein
LTRALWQAHAVRRPKRSPPIEENKEMERAPHTPPRSSLAQIRALYKPSRRRESAGEKTPEMNFDQAKNRPEDQSLLNHRTH